MAVNPDPRTSKPARTSAAPRELQSASNFLMSWDFSFFKCFLAVVGLTTSPNSNFCFLIPLSRFGLGRPQDLASVSQNDFRVDALAVI